MNCRQDQKLGEEGFFKRLQARLHLKRGAAKAWISQFDEALEDLKTAKDFSSVFTPD